MQRLEELNKRDVNYSHKRHFTEFIKTKRKIVIKEKEENLLNNESIKIDQIISNDFIEEKESQKDKHEQEHFDSDQIINLEDNQKEKNLKNDEEENLEEEENEDLEELIKKLEQENKGKYNNMER